MLVAAGNHSYPSHYHFEHLVSDGRGFRAISTFFLFLCPGAPTRQRKRAGMVSVTASRNRLVDNGALVGIPVEPLA